MTKSTFILSAFFLMNACTNGKVPLVILENIVYDWIDKLKNEAA